MNFKFDGDRLFFTSDTHFNHTNILQYCNRPFKTVDQMNETIITNWNNVVGPDDVIFHLGDFCLGGAEEWNKILDRLNGRIYLVLGNCHFLLFSRNIIKPSHGNARWLYLKDNGLFQGDGIGCLALLLADHIGVNLCRPDASVRKHL